jgi:3-deoxy-D-manno-octulosonic-acid transferase
VPEDLDHAGRTAEALARDHGLSVARRSLDEEIEDDTQVYIADTEGELGLWYRLAPVAFFGGTLVPGGRPRHPFEAAALGAAILRGPALAADDPNRPVWDRLGQIGACRIVGDAGDLGDAVGDLLAPDRAAQMARAGWEASSAGTVAAERVVALLLATIGDGNGSREQDAAPLPPSRPRAGKRRGRGA